MTREYVADVHWVVGQIADERVRQIEEEEYDHSKDDRHTMGQLARGAASYAIAAGSNFVEDRHWAKELLMQAVRLWPWHRKTWKSTNPRDDLIKAGAMIVAEIERLDRIVDNTAVLPTIVRDGSVVRGVDRTFTGE